MQDEQGSRSHNTHSHGKDSTHERGSSVIEHKEHHQHQHHQHSTQPETTTTLTSATSSSMMPALINYNVNVQFDPATPQAGKPTELSLIVTEQKVGETIKQFDIIHDKLMHLIIANSEDLSHFAHVHPKLDKETGIFHITHTFAKAGRYKMWIDAKPKGAMQILTAFPFNVEGQPVHTPANITSDKTFVKEVVSDAQRYQVSLDFQPEKLGVGMDTKMTFEIRDANGKPISNLESLMAAGGHCVIIGADTREFLHVHPAEEVDDIVSWRGGPSVSFLANFPKPGLYRAWGQFQHEGKLLTVDFTFEVVA
ncbi:MAG: hypothetical protein M3M86_00590 [Thermoproteota archaeon]|nr:hypothetical protein [Thermoproteota archaeon]